MLKSEQKRWICFLKSVFLPVHKSKPGKKPMRCRWAFRRLKTKQNPSIEAPQSSLNEAREQQRKQALNVAIVTAAAAEAALAAAQAAAEVVRLTGASSSCHFGDESNANLAAVKIQRAFRGHLARKAFRALKGLVRLQAIVRGNITRRRAITALNSSTTSAVTVGERRGPAIAKVCKESEQRSNEQNSSRMTGVELECSAGRSWDNRIFSKEDAKFLWSRKQEAIAKRERMMRYSFSHRERRGARTMDDLIPDNINARLNLSLNQSLERGTYDHKSLDQSANLLTRSKVEAHRLPVLVLPRTSLSWSNKYSNITDGSLPNSPVSPAYMAATESAKAKARSMSMPKQRMGVQDNHYPHNLSNKSRLHSWYSLNGEHLSTKG